MRFPQQPFKRYLVYSQLATYITFLACIAIAPASLADNSGFSYFGHHRWTVVPFGAGILTAAYFLLRSAEFLPSNARTRKLKIFFRSLPILMTGLVVVPAVGNGWYDFIHRLFGTALFLAQLGLAGWLVWRIKNDRLNWLLIILQVSGGLIALIYLNPVQGFELQGQLLFQLAFSVLLLRSLILQDGWR